MRNCICILFATLFFIKTYAQDNNYLDYLIISRRNFNLNKISLEKYNNYSEEILENEIKFLKNGLNYEEIVSSTPKTYLDSVFYYINKGNIEFFNNFNQSENASSFYIRAIEKAETIKNKNVLFHAIRSKLWYDIWFSYGNYLDNEVYLNLYKRHIKSPQEERIFQFFNKLIALRKNDYKITPQFDTRKIPDFYKAWWFNDIAIRYHFNNDMKNSNQSFEKCISILEKSKNYISNLRKSAAYLNRAKIALKNKQLKDAKDYLKNAHLSHSPNKLYYQNQTYLLYRKAEYFNQTKKWDSAYYSIIKYDSLRTSINQRSIIFQVQNLNKKFKTAEKEKQNLILQKEKAQSRNIAFGLGGLLLFGSLIFFLIQKNTRRKQLLAEQEKELQIQRVGTLMKEQELASIDAMIAGQEKERQRIANDLHDDLGGMMATVKLHFNILRDKPSPELYTKTDKLLDEAYQKVRSIAHAKNSGVIAKHGLLKSINEMAEKISTNSNIQIDVVDHGLENRLENSLELTIFRIIQELTTNIIKHANATGATIHLTQHEERLNIMVEDNGKGFNPKKIKKAKGMGISSIDKRVDHLNGSLNIESDIGKGTTIIIDIPV